MSNVMDPAPASSGLSHQPETAKSPRRRRTGRLSLEVGVIVMIAFGLALLLRLLVVQTFLIPSSSMTPTLQIGDRIVVDKLSYKLGSVHRGDLVVFARPPLENCGTPVKDLVKRVVGLPRETISLTHGQVVINGHILKEPWLPEMDRDVTGPGPSSDAPYNLDRPFHIPAGEYFLMGDNRTFSCDSRFWGPIPQSLMVGKVVLRVWPLSGLKIF